MTTVHSSCQCNNPFVSYDKRGFPVPTAVPSTQDATILVAPQRWLFVSTFLPLVLIPVFGFWLLSGSGPVLEGFAFVGGITVALSVRPIIWSFGIGVRSLVATPTHLVEIMRGKPRRWVLWSEMHELILQCSTHAWAGRERHYLLIGVRPDLAVQPTATIVPRLGELAQNYRNAPDAATRIAEQAQRHGVATTIYKDPWGQVSRPWVRYNRPAP